LAAVFLAGLVAFFGIKRLGSQEFN